MCDSIVNSQTSNCKGDTDNYIAGYAKTNINRSIWYANNHVNNNNIECDINDYNSIFCNSAFDTPSVIDFNIPFVQIYIAGPIYGIFLH